MRINKQAQRFSQVVIEDNSIPITETGCWLWLKSITPNQYGILYPSVNGASNQKLAHRYSYEAFVKKIPKGLFVCHKCDIRSCVNPEHLFIGTHQDNMDDMVIKGRSNFKTHYGEAHGQSILDWETVDIIRSYPKYRGYIDDLSNILELKKRTVESILYQENWKESDRFKS